MQQSYKHVMTWHSYTDCTDFHYRCFVLLFALEYNFTRPYCNYLFRGLLDAEIYTQVIYIYIIVIYIIYICRYNTCNIMSITRSWEQVFPQIGLKKGIARNQ